MNNETDLENIQQSELNELMIRTQMAVCEIRVKGAKLTI